MRWPLTLRNSPALAAALCGTDIRRQLLRRALWLRREHGMSWRELFASSRLMLKGERLLLHQGRLIVSSVIPPIPSPAFERFIQNPVEPVYRKGGQPTRPGPVSMFLSVTSACPCRCMHCSRAYRDTVETELNTNEWLAVIAELRAMQVATIGISGGEPLTRPDLERIVGEIGEHASSIVFTTGIGLTLERARRFKQAGLFALAVSLDFADPARHDALRGLPGAHQAALDAMRMGAQAGLYVIAMSVIFKDMLEERAIFELARLARRQGAHEVRLLEPVRAGRLLDSDAAHLYDDADRKRLIAIHHRGNQTAGMPKLATYLYIEGAQKYGCGAGILHSYISETGDLYPCDFIPASFGNVRRGGLQAAWQAMSSCFRMPRRCCIANGLNAALLNESAPRLPLTEAVSPAFFRRHLRGIPTMNLSGCGPR